MILWSGGAQPFPFVNDSHCDFHFFHHMLRTLASPSLSNVQWFFLCGGCPSPKGFAWVPHCFWFFVGTRAGNSLFASSLWLWMCVGFHCFILEVENLFACNEGFKRLCFGWRGRFTRCYRDFKLHISSKWNRFGAVWAYVDIFTVNTNPMSALYKIGRNPCYPQTKFWLCMGYRFHGAVLASYIVGTYIAFPVWNYRGNVLLEYPILLIFSQWRFHLQLLSLHWLVVCASTSSCEQDCTCWVFYKVAWFTICCHRFILVPAPVQLNMSLMDCSSPSIQITWRTFLSKHLGPWFSLDQGHWIIRVASCSTGSLRNDLAFC